jgi:hypothetical protein
METASIGQISAVYSAQGFKTLEAVGKWMSLDDTQTNLVWELKYGQFGPISGLMPQQRRSKALT